MTPKTGFIARTLQTNGIVALLVLIFGSFYFGFYSTLSVFTGIIWGMVNLYFLALLIRSSLRPEGADMATALILILIKFPLLYFSAYLMITSGFFNPLLLLTGFTTTRFLYTDYGRRYGFNGDRKGWSPGRGEFQRAPQSYYFHQSAFCSPL
ncbi:MAG: hypothetical protein NTV06_04610 [candidate division Zixibacteria bacterium]|nr:hypothetical protein [candidate division Zixibacteria bacterium]